MVSFVPVQRLHHYRPMSQAGAGLYSFMFIGQNISFRNLCKKKVKCDNHILAQIVVINEA